MHALAAALLLAGSLAAQDDRCDPGSVELSRDEEARVLVCRLIADLTLEQMAALSPEAVAKLSAADQRALELRRLLLNAAGELPFMPDDELAAFERRLQAESHPPAASALLLALEAALLAVGGFMLLGFGKAFETVFPGGRKGLALGALLGLGVVGSAHLALGIPLTPARAAVTVLRPPIGFAPGLAQQALQHRARLQHASRHLRAEGLLPKNWNDGPVKESFVKGLTQILEHPLHTFDHTLRGPAAARGFVGSFNGRTVVAFVYKQGHHVGQIATVVLPKGYQLKLWQIDKLTGG